MNYLIIIVVVLFSLPGCNHKQPDTQRIIINNFGCTKGQMTCAWYPYGITQALPDIPKIKTKFIILVDTSFKTNNFISAQEQYYRGILHAPDTSNVTARYLIATFGQTKKNSKPWENLIIKQKLQSTRKATIFLKALADSEHVANNRTRRQQVWLINNSSSEIEIKSQDQSPLCILQAKSKTGQWHPIQYWELNTFCGNSYHTKRLPPQKATSFIATIPNRGDYKTKLRFKLLGATTFYYSNEFDGRINYCEFVEDSTSYSTFSYTPTPHFKLDSVLRRKWDVHQ